MAIKQSITITLSVACAFLLAHDVALAFSPLSSSSMRSSSRPKPIRTELYMESGLFADATEPKNVVPEVKIQVDANGKVFVPGAVVAIAPSNRPIKAHQVPKTSFGSFDAATREFIPRDESNVTRGTSCLLLPEGLRGEVAKIYNTNEWDRAHPILVKFNAGEDREGGGDGFNIPKKFTMHLDADEIVVLE